MKETYLRTAAFAALAGVNKKTLHYYDEIGLFRPAYVNEKGYRFYSPFQLDRLALNYVSGSGLCLGLPELIPGRFITIEGLDGDTVGDYFITKVRHQFGSGGYLTQFEVKGAKD